MYTRDSFCKKARIGIGRGDWIDVADRHWSPTGLSRKSYHYISMQAICNTAKAKDNFGDCFLSQANY